MKPRSLLAGLPQRLLRVTTGGGLVAEVDGFRCIAVLAIVLYHLNGYLAVKLGLVSQAEVPSTTALYHTSILYKLFSQGLVGLSLFCAISGFVISLSFVKRARGPSLPWSLKNYYQRRLARLVAPYWINLLIMFALLVFVKRESAVGLLPSLLASAGGVHLFLFGCASRINYVAWFLEVVIQFYAVAPALIFLFRVSNPRLRRGLMLLLALLFLSLSNGIGPSPYVNYTLLGQAHYFLVGILLADLYENSQRVKRRVAFDVLGLVAWGAILGGPHFFQGMVLASITLTSIFVAFYGAFRGPILGRLFSNPGLAMVGGMGYTIYLYHFQIISLSERFLLPRLAPPNHDLLLLVHAGIEIGIVLVVSAFLFLLFERPFMVRDWPKQCAAFLRSWLFPGTAA
jgi:peptidoglycan/LPS O-acetylase OafA/YrhL